MKSKGLTRIFSLLMALTMLTSTLLFGTVEGTSARAAGMLQDLKSEGFVGLQQLQQAQCLDAEGEIAYNALTGKINFVGTNENKPIPQPIADLRFAAPDEAARGYLSVCGSLFGLSDQAAELSVNRQKNVTTQPVSADGVGLATGMNGVPANAAFSAAITR